MKGSLIFFLVVAAFCASSQVTAIPENSAEDAASIVADAVKDGLDEAGNRVDDAADQANEDTEKVEEDVEEKVEEAEEEVGDLATRLGRVKDKVIEKVTEAGRGIKEEVRARAADVEQWTKEAFDALKKAVQERVNDDKTETETGESAEILGDEQKGLVKTVADKLGAGIGKITNWIKGL